MVLDEELRPLHQLTESGKEHYRAFLEEKADEILFKHKHPVKWIAQKIKSCFEK